MLRKFTHSMLGGALALSLSASAAPVTLTKLTGLTGGAPAETAVYKADLSSVGLASILSITIADDSAGLGGSPGRFSGFDLDAIKLSTDDCADAACAAAATFLSVFDFLTGTLFTPGAQRAPADAKLFGTDALGSAVDDTVASLGAFDANSTTGAGANGFLSMGDNGEISFNLSAPTSTAGLFMYIGEVGDNGEVAASDITVQDTRVPQPGSLALIGLGLSLLSFSGWMRSRAARRSD
jgi:hypothetical protein